jgi:hypothetical protein
MKNKGIALTAVLLVLSIGNYFRIISDGSIRTVEFISVFAIGMLSGILLVQLIIATRNKQ